MVKRHYRTSHMMYTEYGVVSCNQVQDFWMLLIGIAYTLLVHSLSFKRVHTQDSTISINRLNRLADISIAAYSHFLMLDEPNRILPCVFMNQWCECLNCDVGVYVGWS